jgi:tetratricopeptide (TPR) repeat protein
MAAAFVVVGTLVTAAPDRGSDSLVRPHIAAAPLTLDPRVEELFRTTYLGNAEDFPDPDESYDILAQYLRRDTHKYLRSPGSSTTARDLDLDIMLWEALVGAAPPSRHGYAALGDLYEIKYQQTADKSWLRQAAVMYEEAVRTALAHGRIRYTRKLASTLSEIGDLRRLHAVFGAVLSQPPTSDPGNYYLALVNYADALAKLGQLDLAWNYFEQAIASNPKGCIFAVNLYTGYLLDHALPLQALGVLERTFTKDERIILAQPAFARKKALQMAGIDTSSADAEIAAVRANFKRGTIGGGMDSGPASSGLTARALAPWAHTNTADDCRVMDYTQLWVDSDTGAWFYCYTVNEAEVLYNEAGGETRGSQAAVAWTIRDRALEVLKGVWNSDGTWAGISCDSYPGGGYSQGTCSVLPCEDVNYVNCPVTRWYCCAIHGGTTAVGTPQYQFNDAHVDWPTLCATGLPYLAYYAQNGLIPDPSSNWAPPNVYNCWFGCNSPYPWCNTGQNFINGSPNGPMEYRNYSYTADYNNNGDCKHSTNFVCPNGGSDNYFWNRTDHVPVGSVSILNQQTLSGCSADPDTPWLTNFVDVYVDGLPGVGYYIGSTGATQYVPGGCNVDGQNYGTGRGFTFTIPSPYRTGHHRFFVVGRNTSNGAAGAGLPPYPLTSPW